MLLSFSSNKAKRGGRQGLRLAFTSKKLNLQKDIKNIASGEIVSYFAIYGYTQTLQLTFPCILIEGSDKYGLLLFIHRATTLF